MGAPTAINASVCRGHPPHGTTNDANWKRTQGPDYPNLRRRCSLRTIRKSVTATEIKTAAQTKVIAVRSVTSKTTIKWLGGYCS